MQDNQAQEIKNTKAEIALHSPKHAKEYFKPNIEALDFLYTIKGKQRVPVLCTENICKALTVSDIFGYFRFDDFKQVYERREYIGKWKPLEEVDAILIQTRIQTVFDDFQTVPKGMVQDAIQKLSLDNRYDSAKMYVESLKWDGKERLSTWLTSAYGVKDNDYHRAIASNWMKGIISRIMRPGCKFDHVLVLEGEQGTKKSMSLGVLGGDWYVETTMSTDNKDFFMQFHGKVIVEFSEGETLSRTEVKRMKAIITTQVDKYRPPYERVSKDFPRRCVFAMTTNQDEYLKDETGNRRWFPVRLIFEEADIAWIKENRDQLFAEAYHRVKNLKETYWEVPITDSINEQKTRRIRDANEDMVTEWYFNQLTTEQRRAGVTVHQCFTDCLGNFSGGMDTLTAMRIANIYKLALDLKKVRKMHNGVQAVRWYDAKMIMMESVIDVSMESPQAVPAEQEELEF